MNEMTNTDMHKRWEKLLTPFRVSSKGIVKDEESLRNSFITDQDRILFSSSFRRLSKKTQVHPLNRNDHIHTRLTHSLEVACVGRTLGLNFGDFLQKRGELPENFTPRDIGDLVYASCLAHDIGNPPFGHAGESAIQDWFLNPSHNTFVSSLSPVQRTDFEAFDGNAQGLRVVASLENNKDTGGLRLSFPTIAAFVKYPNSSYAAVEKGTKKFNFYETEKEQFDTIFSHLELKLGEKNYIRHPLAYISEAADDICYRIIDMEDAFELKILTYDDILHVITPIQKELGVQLEKFKSLESNRRRVSMLRTLVIGKMVKSCTQAFQDNYEDIMRGEQFSLIKKCDAPAQQYMQNAKDIFYTKIAKEPKKIALEIGSYNVYKQLLDVFIPATYYKVQGLSLTYKNEKALELMGVNAPVDKDDLNAAYHRVIDFITGMTDSYATFVSRQFSGTGESA